MGCTGETSRTGALRALEKLLVQGALRVLAELLELEGQPVVEGKPDSELGPQRWLPASLFWPSSPVPCAQLVPPVFLSGRNWLHELHVTGCDPHNSLALEARNIQRIFVLFPD